MDIEWKAEVSRKLKDLSELQSLRKDVQRIVVALEKLAGIEGQDSNEEQFLWLEFEGEEIKVQQSKKKGKQREQELDRVEKKEVGGQKEENGMEGMKEGSSNFSLVVYSVGTGNLQFLFNKFYCFFCWQKVNVSDDK